MISHKVVTINSRTSDANPSFDEILQQKLDDLSKDQFIIDSVAFLVKDPNMSPEAIIIAKK